MVGSLAVAFKEDIEPRVEIGAVVHMPHMRDLMGDDRAAHRCRGHDQPPAERNGPPAGTTAPAAAGIAQRQARDWFPGFVAIMRDFIGENPPCLALEPSQDAGFHRLSWTTQAQHAFAAANAARPFFAPFNQVAFAFDSDFAARGDGDNVRRAV